MNSTSARLIQQQPEIIYTWLLAIHDGILPTDADALLCVPNGPTTFLAKLSYNLKNGRILQSHKCDLSDAENAFSFTRKKSIAQIVQDYSVLRLVVIDAISRSGPISQNEKLLLHRTFDQAIASTCQNFFDSEQNQLKLALASAEASNFALDQFSAVIAHDLKSPLATISGFTDSLISDLSGTVSHDSEECLHIIDRAAMRMRTLVDGVLSYARLNCRVEQFTVFKLSDALESAIENLSASVSASNARVEYRNLPSIQGDQSLILQLLQNLIANSIKYRSVDDPVILVSSEEYDDGYTISLTDNGKGFDPRYTETVFELHNQLDHHHSGAGMGLATCKKIIAIHHGEIWCTSTVGNGAKFSFTLPGVNH